MKRWLSLFLSVSGLLFCLCSCSLQPASSSAPEDASDSEGATDTALSATEQNLMTVLHSENPFLTNGKEVLLKDYVYGEDGETAYIAEPVSYTLVDMDADGTRELIADISPSTVYMVFHQDPTDGKIYGFQFFPRSLQSLKADGSFAGSASADSVWFCRMAFADNTYHIAYTAIADGTENHYEIDGKVCTPEETTAYLEAWYAKPNAEWLPVADTKD